MKVGENPLYTMMARDHSFTLMFYNLNNWRLNSWPIPSFIAGVIRGSVIVTIMVIVFIIMIILPLLSG